MDVSENSGTPKSYILIGFSIINHPFWGTPIFGNIHIWCVNLVVFNVCLVCLPGFYYSDLGLRQISFEPLGTWHFGWLTTTPGRPWETNWRWKPIDVCVWGRWGCTSYFTRWWQLKYLLFSHLFREDEPILTHIFQMGWNHKPVSSYISSYTKF